MGGGDDASFDLASARGDHAEVTRVVEKLTGKVPTSVHDFLRTAKV